MRVLLWAMCPVKATMRRIEALRYNVIKQEIRCIVQVMLLLLSQRYWQNLPAMSHEVSKQGEMGGSTVRDILSIP